MRKNRCVKLFISLLMLFSFTMIVPNKIYANNDVETFAVVREKTVNQTVSDKMSQGGCWATVFFDISGRYTYSINGSSTSLVNNDVTVTIKEAPSDWVVEIDSLSYRLVQDDLEITIRYHYKASDYDCAFQGGYQYTALVVVV